jgi:hypothetical protein
MINNIFEYATRNKIRFQSSKGLLSVEQLWEVPLRSKDDFNLNELAKNANRDLKMASEESFVETARTPAHTRLEVTFELVKHVIAAKIEDEKAARTRAENKIKKDKLLAVLAEKQDGKLSELSIQELQKQIAALDE